MISKIYQHENLSNFVSVIVLKFTEKKLATIKTCALKYFIHKLHENYLKNKYETKCRCSLQDNKYGQGVLQPPSN